MKLFGRIAGMWAVMILGLSLLGCATDAPPKTGSFTEPVSEKTTGSVGAKADADLSSGRIHVGDEVTVNVTDTPTQILPVNLTVKEDGSITLMYNQNFIAAGKTSGELQEEIRSRYVPKFYKYLTISVHLQDRYFSVGGEVKLSGRFPYSGKITVLQAINTAGGFTDFSSKTHVKLIRSNGSQQEINCKQAIKNPKLDLEIFPGDQLYVPKRF